MFVPSAQTQAEVGDAKPRATGWWVWFFDPLFSVKFLLLDRGIEYLQFFSREIRS